MMTFKKTTLGLFLFTMSIFGVACSGATEDGGTEQKLTLTPSKTTINADAVDAVNFKVLDELQKDVTSEATIRCTTDNTVVEGASFTTATAGNYIFEATHGDVVSSSVKVIANKVDAPVGKSKYARNVCVMEFTGQWCAKCPSGYTKMVLMINRYFKDIAHVIALHDDTTDKDEFAIPVQAELARAFNLQAYPAVLVDLRTLSPLLDDQDGTFRKSVTASLEEHPAHCGVALKSVYNESSKTAEVTVRVASEKTEKYRMAIFVVEDDIISWQNNGSYTDKEYIHNHVARRLVSETYNGDLLGEIKAGEEKAKTYNILIDTNWNLDNTSIYALAIGADGHINNMITCKLVNGESDYELVTE